MSKKFNAALGAYKMLKEKKGPLVLGIGTGSTTDYFTKEFLPKLKENISDLYSSSKRTTKLLTDLGFTICEYKPGSSIDIYPYPVECLNSAKCTSVHDQMICNI